MAVRLGFNLVGGLRLDHANLIVARRRGGYDSIRDLWLRTGLSSKNLIALADADAFQSLGVSRRDAHWIIQGMEGQHGAERLPLFQAGERPPAWNAEEIDLPPMTLGEEVIHDYRTLSISLKAHPVSFLREKLERRRVTVADNLRTAQPGRSVTVAGLVLVRQRPGTASGVIFATLEDETGVANIIIWPKVFEANRRVVLGARVLGVRGILQREGIVIHVIAKEFFDLTSDIAAIAGGVDIGERTIARADEAKSGGPKGRNREQEQYQAEVEQRLREALPKGRNFH